MNANAPSTHWKENPASDEARRFEAYAGQFAQLQKRKSERYGKGRALHRKQLLAARAQFTVFKDLPDFARQGLFAAPGTFPAWVRLSNGGMDKAADTQPDIRGFAFAVQGLKGASALGSGQAGSQGFALINQEKFAFPKSDEFVDFVIVAGQGKGALLKYLIKRYGLIAGPARLLAMVRNFSRPFSGFAHQDFFSAAPIACGPYAVRVRLRPGEGNGPTDPKANLDWGADLARRLKQHPLSYTLELQPFVNEKQTPIEDASVDWPSPYTAVGRLELPVQDIASPEGLKLAEEAEASSQFDPWSALADHRPLGDVMRARKVVYFESQKGRGATNTAQ